MSKATSFYGNNFLLWYAQPVQDTD